MKPFELFIIVLFMSFLLFLLINEVDERYQMYQKYYIFLDRFYTGRYLIKKITETYPFSNKICNLTDYFLNLFNKDFFISFLNNESIRYPIKLELRNLNGSLINKIGGVGDNFIEFRRVCYYKGSLYIISLKI